MIEKDQLLNRLFQVVAYNIRHKHYEHTIAKHKLYMQLVAGVGLDEKLRQYVRRETEELFKQRVQLTEHIVPAISKNLLDVFYKVPRSNSARRVISYSEEGIEQEALETKVQVIEDMLSKFWGAESWDDYMNTRFIELNSIDPNAFVVFEWAAFDNRFNRIQPRPYEVHSSAAVDFRFDNKELQYLTVKDKHNVVRLNPEKSDEIVNPNEKLKPGVKYTLYGKDQTWQLFEIHPDDSPFGTGGKQGEQAVKDGRTFIKLNDHTFEFIEREPHKNGAVPAFRVGYYRDLATNGETFVNPLHAVEPFLEKTIKVNSEMDITATLLAFPQMIKYGQACEDSNCLNGYYDGDVVCKTCKGSGIKPTAPSTQDAIVIQMPKSREEALPLDEFLKYIHPPVDIIDFQHKYVEHLTEKAKRIMFNSDTFSPQEVAKTATGQNLDMQNVYDTLHPFALKFGRVWTQGVNDMAKLADRSKNLVASYTFGKDFKLKTLDGLIVDLERVSKIGNAMVQEHIGKDIAQIIFSEKPMELQRFELKTAHNPFRGKSEKEVFMLMNSQDVPRKQRVLHANYARVFDELELEGVAKGVNFYKLNKIEQRELIDAKVQEIIDEIDEETPDPEVPLEI